MTDMGLCYTFNDNATNALIVNTPGIPFTIIIIIALHSLCEFILWICVALCGHHGCLDFAGFRVRDKFQKQSLPFLAFINLSPLFCITDCFGSQPSHLIVNFAIKNSVSFDNYMHFSLSPFSLTFLDRFITF